MKLMTVAVFLLSLSSGAFAQDIPTPLAISTVTLYPTMTISNFFGGNSYAVGHTTASVSFKLYASLSSVESKGVNVKNQLREESTAVADILGQGQEVKLKNFKTLSAMISELKNDEASFLEIQEAADKNQVSFEIMAIRAIMLATDV